MGPALVVPVVVPLVLARTDGGASVGGGLAPAPRQGHVHLDALDTGPIHVADIHRHVRDAQPRRKLLQPVGGCTDRDQRPQKHIAADPRGRIDNSKPTV